MNTLPGWSLISSAPRDGTRFIGRKTLGAPGKLRYLKRVTSYGKTSHVPLYGFCHGKGEDFDLWEPTHWRPLNT